MYSVRPDVVNVNSVWPDVVDVNSVWSDVVNVNYVWSDGGNVNSVWPDVVNLNSVWPGVVNLNSVWPDVGIKSNPIFCKVVQEVATGVLLKSDVLKNSYKVTKYLGHLERKFVLKSNKKIAPSTIL